jgi:hypothetical protein
VSALSARHAALTVELEASERRQAARLADLAGMLARVEASIDVRAREAAAAQQELAEQRHAHGGASALSSSFSSSSTSSSGSGSGSGASSGSSGSTSQSSQSSQSPQSPSGPPAAPETLALIRAETEARVQDASARTLASVEALVARAVAPVAREVQTVRDTSASVSALDMLLREMATLRAAAEEDRESLRASIAETMGGGHAAVARLVDASVQGSVATAVQGAVATAVQGAVAIAVETAVEAKLGNAVHTAVTSAVGSTVSATVNATVNATVGSKVNAAVSSAVEPVMVELESLAHAHAKVAREIESVRATHSEVRRDHIALVERVAVVDNIERSVNTRFFTF